MWIAPAEPRVAFQQVLELCLSLLKPLFPFTDPERKKVDSLENDLPSVDYAETLRAMCERVVRKFGIRCLVRDELQYA